MSDEKVLSFDDFASDPDIRFENIPTTRGTVRIGSASSADILEWMDENDDPKTKRFAGLRLLAKCYINPDGSRIPREQWDDAVAKLAKRDGEQNGKLVQRCLLLNGLRVRPKSPRVEDEVKNGSSEAASGASPADSPSPQGA